MLKLLVLTVFSSISLLVPSIAFAEDGANSATGDISEVCKSNPQSSLCAGYSKGESAADDKNPILATLTVVINILSFIAGVLSVFLVMFGGFKYITSAGDAGKVASAKNTILYALVGLVVVVISRQLILFVLSKVL